MAAERVSSSNRSMLKAAVIDPTRLKPVAIPVSASSDP